MQRLILAICLFFQSCASTFEKPDYIMLSDELAYQYARAITNEYSVSLCGYGGSRFSDIKKMYLHFEGNQKLTVDEMRVMYVKNVEQYLQLFNSSPQIRSYMHDYPFTVKNLKLLFSFTDKKKKHDVEPPYVSFVFNVGDIIYYESTDPVTDKFITLKKETYEEALRIVREQGLQL